MRDDALSRVRVSLTLEAIGAAEDIKVTEEEINKELEKMSEQFGMEFDQIKQTLRRNKNA